MVQPKHKAVAVPLEIRQEVARNVLKRPMLVEELLKRVRKVHPDATVEQVSQRQPLHRCPPMVDVDWSHGCCVPVGKCRWTAWCSICWPRAR